MEDLVGKKVDFSFLGERMTGECIEKRMINDSYKYICKSGKYKFPVRIEDVKVI